MTPLKLFIVAGEHSGDALGGPLIKEISAQFKGDIRLSGVGGEAMAEQGLESLVDLNDIAVMGPIAILKKLPKLISIVKKVQRAAVQFEPDILIIIDSPEFSHPIAKAVKKAAPKTPVINYVCPSVWAWRPWRAKKMRRYIDHVLCLLPFEPKALARLSGPQGTYVGHSLCEKLDWIVSCSRLPVADKLPLLKDEKLVVLLPGSRRSEMRALLPIYKQVVNQLYAHYGNCLKLILPTVPRLEKHMVVGTKNWAVTPYITSKEEEKFASFTQCHAALAASGTVTLELGVSGTPSIVTYKVDGLARHLRFLVKTPSIVLTNLVLGHNVYPEYIQEDCNQVTLTTALRCLIDGGADLGRQKEALADLPAKMTLGDGISPSQKAASICLAQLQKK